MDDVLTNICFLSLKSECHNEGRMCSKKWSNEVSVLFSTILTSNIIVI